jgi:hypothetical protein
MTWYTEIAADTPALWWELEDAVGTTTPVDSSGNGRDATVQGTVSPGFGQPHIAANLGTCLGLNGTGNNNYLGRVYEAGLDVGTGDFAFEFIIQCDNDLSNYVEVFSRDQGVSGNGQLLYLQTGTGAVRTWIGGQVLVGTQRLSDNNRHHVVISRTSGVVTVYVDTAVDASATMAGNTDRNSDVLLGVTSAAYATYHGDISHFIYYKHGLTAARVAAHYNELGAQIVNRSAVDSAPATAISFVSLARPGQAVGYIAMNVGLLAVPTDEAHGYIEENVGLYSQPTHEAHGYVVENTGIVIPSTTREAHGYIVLDQLASIFSPDGIAYGYENAGLEVVGTADGVAYGYYGEVTGDQPWPHIWYITPVEIAEGSHAAVAIVGTGFGDTADQYDANVFLDETVVADMNVIEWANLRDDGAASKVIDGVLDVADPEHQRITMLVPYDAESALVSVRTHTKLAMPMAVADAAPAADAVATTLTQTRVGADGGAASDVAGTHLVESRSATDTASASGVFAVVHRGLVGSERITSSIDGWGGGLFALARRFSPNADMQVVAIDTQWDVAPPSTQTFRVGLATGIDQDVGRAVTLADPSGGASGGGWMLDSDGVTPGYVDVSGATISAGVRTTFWLPGPQGVHLVGSGTYTMMMMMTPTGPSSWIRRPASLPGQAGVDSGINHFGISAVLFCTASGGHYVDSGFQWADFSIIGVI